MSILMSSMSSFSHYDPFNLFDTNNQEHYLQPPSTAFSPTSYATPHQFPVDPRWFNSSFSGHATAAPHQFSPMTHSVITPPNLQTDLLSLSPSSTITPIPPLSGSRNRSRSMSNRIRSFNQASTTRAQPQRPSSGSARGAAQNTTQRIARRSTVSSSSPSLGHHHHHHQQSPSMGMQSSSPSTTSYLHSPTTLEHEDSHETRASKRRRTDDVDSASLHSYSTVPEPPHLLTPPPHLALLQQHQGYPPSQTWAGPPSAGHHIPHGVSPDHHGYTQWPPAPLYFTPEHQGLGDHHHHHHQQQQQQQHHQHLHLQHQLSATSDASHTPILPYPSPTVAGPGFFNSPEPEAPVPVSAVSTTFQFHKMEPDSPRLLEDVVGQQQQPHSLESFEHGPTEFPPRAYPGGVDAKSPWVPTKPVGKIFGSRLEQMPAIENRLAKLEDQLDRYLDGRAAQSLRNSLLPGLESQSQPMEYAPLGPCRMFGGRIWPTALARRVRRTPRD